MTRAEADLWQVSAMLVDVETAETVRAETLNFKGAYRDLLFQGMDQLARRIAFGPQAAAASPARPEPVEATPPTSWRVKWIGGLALGLAAAYYGYSEAQATARANDKQKSILDDMAAATTSAQYAALEKKLKSEEEAAKTHSTNSNAGYAAAAVLIGLAAWVYFDPPPATGDRSAWVPLAAAAPGALRVGVALRW